MTISTKTIMRVGVMTVVAAAPLLVFADNTFVPLTDIPAFKQFSTPSDLPAFLNALYNICIGVAVVLSVLQLVRAGITYSMSDAISSKEEAKHLILVSILGLVLVLSPYIVFSIINPSILKLNIDTSGITPAPPSAVAPANPSNNSGASGTPPSVPTNVQVTGHTANSITLTWTPSTASGGAAAYDVYVNGGNPARTIGTSITISGLTPGSTVTVSVQARDIATGQISDRSAGIPVTLDAATASDYLWKSSFESWPSQGSKDAGANPSKVNNVGGPFTTSQACMADLTAKEQAYAANITSHSAGTPAFNYDTTCTCQTPASQQPSCQ